MRPQFAARRSVRRRFGVPCAIAALSSSAVAGRAQTGADEGPGVPFGLSLGTSTLAEAEAKWAAHAAVVRHRGHAAIGAASGVDGAASLAADRIVLVDVEAVPFEGTHLARFVFFDNVL